MSSDSSLRKRGGKKEAALSPDTVSSPSVAGQGGSVAPKRQSQWNYRLAMAVLTVLAFITRFYKISYPDEVIFDEVHFGKVCCLVSSGQVVFRPMLTWCLFSSPRTISNGPISSMSTPHSVNSSLP